MSLHESISRKPSKPIFSKSIDELMLVFVFFQIGRCESYATDAFRTTIRPSTSFVLVRPHICSTFLLRKPHCSLPSIHRSSSNGIPALWSSIPSPRWTGTTTVLPIFTMYREEKGVVCEWYWCGASSLRQVRDYLMTRNFLQIGINYRGTSSELRGCINDAQNVQRFICRESEFRIFPSNPTHDLTLLFHHRTIWLQTRRHRHAHRRRCEPSSNPNESEYDRRYAMVG